jgi:general secretion pathway protein A
LDSIEDDQSYFRISSKPNGISIHRIEADMGLLRNLNLPAILEFYPPGGPAPGYLTLTKIDGDRIELGGAADDRVIVTDQNEIESYWTGVAYIPWKNFLSIWGTIPSHTYKDSIITLKLLLHELGFANFEINAEYDDPTQIAVEKIQAKYGVPVDGFVGPLTKIILYRERQSFDMPRLTKDDSRFVDRKK